MSKRASSHIANRSLRRGVATVVAAGIGATALFGAGAAFAADNDTILAGTTNAASALDKQADAQSTAAKKAAEAQKKSAAAAKKSADAKAASAKKLASEWVTPVDNYTLGSTFGTGGNLWSSGSHSGQDFVVASGTPVKAVHGGTVVKASNNLDGAGDGSAYGNAIVIKHDNGTYSQYAHLTSANVKVGQTVTTGQVIGYSGSTGNSTGPHLHFEIRTTPDYGSAVNPVAFLRGKGVTV
ncbi:M23 family metallopeptidase [Streptomyces sp. NBC_01465]|uniref:M23 family metallopeptidase n=1 Tax=Streptomyces sp. NBC_01465 TaxID=2903878 RepID=UPI002E34BEC1|nr:M23 family metallopeptidase [Streptomyces sp. NBC_01465]